MQTLDFELEIGPGADQSYPVSARAPGGDAATSMHLPLTHEELDHQLALINDAVRASSGVTRRLATGDERPVQQFGRRMFEAMVTDDVRALYVASAPSVPGTRAQLFGWSCASARRSWPGCPGSSSSTRAGRTISA